MAATEQSLLLFGGVLAVLVVASIIGFALAHRYASSAPNPTIDNLNSRIKAWWLMVIAIGLAFALGKAGIIILFAFASLAALREFITLTPTRRGDHAALAISFFVVLPLQYYLIWIEWYGLYSIFIPVYVFLLLPIIVAMRGDTRDFMGRVAEIQWGLMICVFCLSHVPALITLPIPGFAGRNLLLIAFLVLVVQSSDVLQYVWGKLLGRRQIAPQLSPSKTVEGTVGGILSATALGAALWWITPFAPWQAGLMALAINLMGFCGGLVMSAIKRDRGVKDWGWLIEGHGGVRIGSIR
jgi:phosphatidate cytidylyltransferase